MLIGSPSESSEVQYPHWCCGSLHMPRGFQCQTSPASSVRNRYVNGPNPAESISLTFLSVNIRAHSPFSWPSMPAPNARVGTHWFTGWSAEIMAATTSGCWRACISPCEAKWASVEITTAPRRQFLLASHALFTAWYLNADGWQWK